MQLAETFEPERQVADFVLPAKHTFNGGESFLEDRRVEKWLAAAFGRLQVSGIRVDVRHHAAIENGLPVTPTIVDTVKAYDRSLKISASKNGLRPGLTDFLPLELGLMFGTIPRLEIAFRLRRQS